MPLPGGTSLYLGEAGSAYNAFTPMPGAGGTGVYGSGMDSPIQGSPTQVDMYSRPMMPGTTPIHAGATPGPLPGTIGVSGGASAYGAGTTPAYPRANAAGSTPGYPAAATSSPSYYAPMGGPSASGPAYAPYSPAPYTMQAGGRTPGYQPGGQPAGASPRYMPTMGQSPTYRPAMGQSPVYNPGAAGYSPTGGHYAQPEPLYSPLGQTPGAPKAPDRKDQDKK